MSELNDLEGAFNIIVEEVYNSKFYGHFQYYPQSPVDALPAKIGDYEFEILHYTSPLDSFLHFYTGDKNGINKNADILWKFNAKSLSDPSDNYYEPHTYVTSGSDTIWRTKSMDLKFYNPKNVKNIRGYFYLVFWISNKINQVPTRWKTIDKIYYQTMPPSNLHNNDNKTFDNSNPLHEKHYEDRTDSVLDRLFQFPKPEITSFEIVSNEDFIKGNISWGAIGTIGKKVQYNIVINNRDDARGNEKYDLKEKVDVDINSHNDPSENKFNNFGKYEIEISNYPGLYKHNYEIKSLNTFKIGGSQVKGIATEWSDTYSTDVNDPSNCVFWKAGKNITDFLVLDISANENGNVSWTHYANYEEWFQDNSNNSGFVTPLKFDINLLEKPIQYKLRMAYSKKSEERARLAALDSQDGNSICCTDWDVNITASPNDNDYFADVGQNRAEFNYLNYKKHAPNKGYYYISIEMVSPLKTDKDEIIYVVTDASDHYSCSYYRLDNVPSRELYRKTNQNTIVTESLKRKYARVIRSKRTKCNF